MRFFVLGLICKTEILGATKFRSLIEDNLKIGANAELFLVTILEKNSTVERLKLINQLLGY